MEHPLTRLRSSLMASHDVLVTRPELGEDLRAAAFRVLLALVDESIAERWPTMVQPKLN